MLASVQFISVPSGMTGSPVRLFLALPLSLVFLLTVYFHRPVIYFLEAWTTTMEIRISWSSWHVIPLLYAPGGELLDAKGASMHYNSNQVIQTQPVDDTALYRGAN